MRWLRKMGSVGLYVHIPFCAVKCPYCDFYSVKYRSDLVQRYVDKIVNEMQRYDCIADTLYFGGGTPSLLKPQLIAKIVDAAVDRFSFSGEVTLEANPNTLSMERLRDYRSAGINRLSMGMQSANSDELIALGRQHSFEQLESAVCDTVQIGINNISVDLMLGTPYQTPKSLENTLNAIKQLPITHLSAYMLSIEQGTPYDGSPLVEHCIDEDGICELYKQTVTTLDSMGLAQYETSNFAKVGFESAHNLKYWRCDDYIGFGASAHSCYNGRRFYHPADIERYISIGEPILDSEEVYTDEERVMLGLRLKEGISIDYFNSERFYEWVNRMGRFVKIGDNRISLTVDGYLVQNSIIAQLIDMI